MLFLKFAMWNDAKQDTWPLALKVWPCSNLMSENRETLICKNIIAKILLDHTVKISTYMYSIY